MDFTRETLEFLSWSSSIDLHEEELEELQKDLRKILNYVESLSQLETQQVSPMVSPADEYMSNVVREDVLQNEPQDSAILFSNAPEHVANMIRVPTVIHKP